MSKINLIGIGSTARVGKDLLSRLLRQELAGKGYQPQPYSLANALKADCEFFLKDKLNMDVWTNDSNEKAKFRDFLVWYGRVKREESNGTYWTNLIQQQIENDRKAYGEKFVAVVADIRYSDPRFREDEVTWVKDKMNGVLINLDRRLPDGSYVLPANKDEEMNSLRVRAASHLDIMWDTAEDGVLIKEYVKPIATFAINKFKS